MVFRGHSSLCGGQGYPFQFLVFNASKIRFSSLARLVN